MIDWYKDVLHENAKNKICDIQPKKDNNHIPKCFDTSVIPHKVKLKLLGNVREIIEACRKHKIKRAFKF